MPTCLIALGSNLGDRAQTMGRAVQAIAALTSTQLSAVSSWHRTSPVGGPPGQGEFLNGAMVVETRLSAEDLHQSLKRIETELGRTPGVRWAQRALDLDLLLYGEQIISTPELSVPHPRMALRRFVLAPAAEVAAELRHPVIGWTIEELLKHLNTARPYVAVSSHVPHEAQELANRVVALTSARLIMDPAEQRGDTFSDGRNSHAALELLRKRAALLASVTWPAEGRWTISTFWLEEPPITAEGCDLENFDEAAERQRLIAAAVPPKLLVWIGSRDMAALPCAHGSPRSGAFDSKGPFLALTPGSIEQNVSEVVAAMESMR